MATKKEHRRLWICRVLLLWTSLWTSPATSQPGFLSIDCGSDKDYLDNTTGISWVSDAGYISTGSNVNSITVAKDNYENWNRNQLGTLRYFAERSKNCYVLPTKAEQTYLLRAVIYKGDWKQGGKFFRFRVYLNSTLWWQQTYTSDDFWDNYASSREAIFYSPSTVLNFCLVREAGVAIVSTLELRELASGMYSKAVGPAKTVLLDMDMANFGRVDCSTGEDAAKYRYPDDPYDRIWISYAANTTTISNPGAIANMNTVYPDQPPPAVVQDAWVYYNSNILWHYFPYSDVQGYYGQSLENYGPALGDVYTTAYFLEVDGNASDTNVRGMTYTLNDKFVTSFNASNRALEIWSPVQHINDRFINISFLKANWSNLKPILNAFEIYFVKAINVSKMADQDIGAISALQTQLNLTDWTGDPCLPVPYDWIGCAQDNEIPTLFRVTMLSLENMGIKGQIPAEISNLTALTNLTLSNNSFNGSIPDFTTLVHLQSLNLANNFLSGDIPSFGGLRNLTQLFLNNNSLNGSIPGFATLVDLQSLNLENNFLIGNIPSFAGLRNLTQLHLDNNNLTGGVPANLLANSKLNFSRSNNPGLPCNGNLSCSSSSKHNSSTSVGVIVGSILGGMAVLAIIGGILWFVCTNKRRARSNIVKAIGQAGNPSAGKQSINRQSLSKSISMMTLQEVSDATNKFSTKIGEGSFGPVYRGRLTNGQEVAIKVKSIESRQGFSEFINEVDMLSRIHHRNLVSLVGYCEEADQQILIYVYVSNGSLQDHLYGKKSKNGLTWQTRLDIAIDSARGVQYLHTDCNPRIIHRDVKSANILLDENMGAKVADFGVSKAAPEGTFTGVDTVLKGTPGYLDPEYFISQRLTPKSDVYSFGVVLLEIISGCHPHVSHHPDGTSGTLLQWARKSVNDGNAKNLFDPSMGGNFNHESIMKCLSLALRCTDPSTAKRPIMAKVVRELTEACELELDGEISLKAYPVTDEISEEKHDTGDTSNDFMDATTGSEISNDNSIVLPR